MSDRNAGAYSGGINNYTNHTSKEYSTSYLNNMNNTNNNNNNNNNNNTCHVRINCNYYWCSNSSSGSE